MTTAEQIAIVFQQAEWPLKRLRKHQQIMSLQLQVAVETKNLRAAETITTRLKLVDTAINLKEFGIEI